MKVLLKECFTSTLCWLSTSLWSMLQAWLNFKSKFNSVFTVTNVIAFTTHTETKYWAKLTVLCHCLTFWSHQKEPEHRAHCGSWSYNENINFKKTIQYQGKARWWQQQQYGKRLKSLSFLFYTIQSVEKSDFCNKICFCWRNRKYLSSSQSDLHLTSYPLMVKIFMLELEFMPCSESGLK